MASEPVKLRGCFWCCCRLGKSSSNKVSSLARGSVVLFMVEEELQWDVGYVTRPRKTFQ